MSLIDDLYVYMFNKNILFKDLGPTFRVVIFDSFRRAMIRSKNDVELEASKELIVSMNKDIRLLASY